MTDLCFGLLAPIEYTYRIPEVMASFFESLNLKNALQRMSALAYSL
jgi:hypothetical protein